MQIISGKIIDISNEGIHIFAPFTDIDRLVKRKYEDVQIGLEDGRTISPEQRRKAYALLRDIGDWQGEHTEAMKRLLKLKFITESMHSLAKEMFSLSNCDMTLAREFISFLIDFVLEWGVPTKKPILEVCDDIQKAVYSALIHKRCILCGRTADMHHVDAIGMGNNRDDVFQVGMHVVPLCREHHAIAHNKGVGWLLDDMHVEPAELTVEIGKVYGLSKRSLGL